MSSSFTAKHRMMTNGTTVKIMVLGEAGVGKTSLIKRFTGGSFSSRMSTTIGVDKIYKYFSVDGQPVHLQLLDTAGSLKFQGIMKSYMSSVDAAIFMYDVSNKETFAALPMWVSLLQNVCCNKRVIKLLLGNKLDLPREVITKNAKNYADFEGMLCAETSVKDEGHVDNTFQILLQGLLRNS